LTIGMPLISFLRRLGPAWVVAVFLVVYAAYALAQNHGDVMAMARLGDPSSARDPAAWLKNYDGQFVYSIALDPTPSVAAPRLDVPAYRYQRILLPLLARLVALAQPAVIPWALLGINFVAQVWGTWLVGEGLVAHGVSRWYALVFGLWVGSVFAVRLALTEPLAYGLVAGAWVASLRRREGLTALLFGLALFAKETTAFFIAAYLLWLGARRDWRSVVRLSAVALVPFAVFQGLLWGWFGQPGLGSGGLLATPFEVIPFMGLWRIAAVSLPAFALFAAIFVPMLVLPCAWAIVASLRRMLQRDWGLPVLALAANAALLPFTPFSTFREPLGMTRLMVGFVLSTLYFGAYTRSRRVMNYAVFWLAALVMLLNDPR
jgi:hypothetical protein